MENAEALSGVPTQEPLIQQGWLRGLMFLVIHFVGMSVIAVVILLILGFNLADLSNYSLFLTDPDMIYLQTALLLWAILAAFMFRRLIDNKSFVSLGFEFSFKWAQELAAGLLLGIVLMTILFSIAWYTGAVTITGWHFPVGTFIVVFINILFAASVEEIVVRGYLLNNFMTSMNKYMALVLTAVIFSIAHGLNPNVGLIGLLNILLAGLLLGVYYVHKKNLWFPIGLHFTWNFFQGFVFSSPVSGIQLDGIIQTEYSGSDFLTGGAFGFEASLAASIIMIGAIFLIHFNYRNSSKESLE